MRIAISGSSGLVGQALVEALESADHEVVRLVRGTQTRSDGEVPWDPQAGKLDPTTIAGCDAVINLNGSSIAGRRWTGNFKNELRASRMASTQTLVRAIGALEAPPRVMLSASATGFYGDRGEELLYEDSAPGSSFLATLARDWEDCALAARSEKTRVVLLRLGMVVSRGGALGKMLLPFKLGAGGPIGSGKQFWPWIAMNDVIGAIRFVLENERLEGPVNVVSPQETRCRDFASTLGRVLRRPSFLPLPAVAARVILGEMADGLLLASARVKPRVLETAGYAFRTPSIEDALRTALGR
jgi:uncharacterized protein (TIGR01777 family)